MFYGLDASGKTTITNDLKNLFKNFFKTKKFSIGKPYPKFLINILIKNNYFKKKNLSIKSLKSNTNINLNYFKLFKNINNSININLAKSDNPPEIDENIFPNSITSVNNYDSSLSNAVKWDFDNIRGLPSLTYLSYDLNNQSVIILVPGSYYAQVYYRNSDVDWTSVSNGDYNNFITFDISSKIFTYIVSYTLDSVICSRSTY